MSLRITWMKEGREIRNRLSCRSPVQFQSNYYQPPRIIAVTAQSCVPRECCAGWHVRDCEPAVNLRSFISLTLPQNICCLVLCSFLFLFFCFLILFIWVREKGFRSSLKQPRPYDITVLNASDFLDLLTSRAFERVARQPEREAWPYERGARASESSCRVLPHQTRKPSERLFKFGAEYI